MKYILTLSHALRSSMAAVLIAFSLCAQAGPGHDHGDEAPAASGTASPRVSTHSDLFELVGIVDQ